MQRSNFIPLAPSRSSKLSLISPAVVTNVSAFVVAASASITARYVWNMLARDKKVLKEKPKVEPAKSTPPIVPMTEVEVQFAVQERIRTVTKTIRIRQKQQP
jgi:hypothetical protein